MRLDPLAAGNRKALAGMMTIVAGGLHPCRRRASGVRDRASLEANPLWLHRSNRIASIWPFAMASANGGPMVSAAKVCVPANVALGRRLGLTLMFQVVRREARIPYAPPRPSHRHCGKKREPRAPGVGARGLP